uniref:Polyprotein n=1 Tax=Cajanus cajan TaxID=3821 RepID=A0A151RFX0_CAJCA|nr:polyprotein [Cajanus cajan]
MILGTPFLTQIYPFTVTTEGIQFKEILFEFINPKKIKEINNIKDVNEDNFITRIKAKSDQIKFLKNEIKHKNIEEKIHEPKVREKFKEIEQEIIKEICSEVPNAFWDRNSFEIELPYEEGFSEKDIPTKAKPVQLNKETLEYCRKEIKQFLDKKLIRPSKSPWSCAAFYVQNASEIERGEPRMVINYKPLNKALKWIRYPLPNKSELISRIYNAVIFSKFDMKSGYYQIKVKEEDKYKTAFVVPFGQYELRKNPKPWTPELTKIVQEVKAQVKTLPCLGIPNPEAQLIVEIDASEQGYGRILKQKIENHPEQIVKYHSGIWNPAQSKYSTIKKEILSIVLCLQKFQHELINKPFLLRIDCKSAKEVLEKDVKNLVSKQIFARWQSLISCFDFQIEFIKGKNNSIPDFLTREFLQGFPYNHPNQTNGISQKEFHILEICQHVVTLEEHWQDEDLWKIVKNLAPPHWSWIPKNENLKKTKKFYQFILIDTGSVEITPVADLKNPSIINYSKLKIIKVLSYLDWKQHPCTEKNFSRPFDPPSYSYFDYQKAWTYILLEENPKHSWYISFKNELPLPISNWFVDWFFQISPVQSIIPENVLNIYRKYKLLTSNQPPHLRLIKFCSTMGISWLLAHLVEIHQHKEETYPKTICRKTKVFWWKKFEVKYVEERFQKWKTLGL